MRLSAFLLIVAVTALPTTITGSKEATATTLLSPEAIISVVAGRSASLRGLKTVDVNDDSVEEERVNFNFGSLKKLVPGSSTNKASKALKATNLAEEKETAKMFENVLQSDDFLYKSMAIWRGKGTSATTIYNQMKHFGRTVHEANTVFKRYSVYLQEMAAAGRPK